MSFINLNYEELLLGAYELLTTYVSSYESGNKGEPVTDIAEIGKCLNEFAVDYLDGIESEEGAICFERNSPENSYCSIKDFMRLFHHTVELIKIKEETAYIGLKGVDTEGEQS